MPWPFAPAMTRIGRRHVTLEVAARRSCSVGLPPPPQRKNETPPLTLRWPKCTWAKSELPPSKPLVGEHVVQRRVVDELGLEPAEASVETDGTSWNPFSRASNFFESGTFAGPSRGPATAYEPIDEQHERAAASEIPNRLPIMWTPLSSFRPSEPRGRHRGGPLTKRIRTSAPIGFGRRRRLQNGRTRR